MDPRWALAEFEMEFAEHAAACEALARVLVEAGDLSPDEILEIADLRNAVTVIDKFEPDWRRWLPEARR